MPDLHPVPLSPGVVIVASKVGPVFDQTCKVLELDDSEASR